MSVGIKQTIHIPRFLKFALHARIHGRQTFEDLTTIAFDDLTEIRIQPVNRFIETQPDPLPLTADDVRGGFTFSIAGFLQV